MFMTISEQIINIRKTAGLSQAEIAKHLGLTAGAICNYEKGRRPIRAVDFEKIKALALIKQVETAGGVVRP